MSTKRDIRYVCQKRGWTYQKTNKLITIRTRYEVFFVQENDDGNAILLSGCVMGGKPEYNTRQLDIGIQPGTPKNIAAHIDRVLLITNDDQFCQYWYDVIKQQCEQYGMSTEVRFGLIYIHSSVEEFYIEPNLNDPTRFDLFHRGIKAWSIDSNPYHRQKRDGLTYGNVTQYIYQHTQNKYGNIQKGNHKQ